MKKPNNTVNVIGAGLAGTECAIYLANHGVKVNLYDIKPNNFTPAHKSQNLGELVCSNSLKSNDIFGNAAGLLKEEMRKLGSKIIAIADETEVPAGNALAVDREKFSRKITDEIFSNGNITFKSEEITDIDFDGFTVIATGPLTTKGLSDTIMKLTGGFTAFYDASAPIVTKESIDYEHAFFGDRWDKGNGDHLNLPMNKEEYLAFYDALIDAERADMHDVDNSEVFEGCMPVEVMAKRGVDTLRFGPLKPAGLTDPKTGRWPYACLQLRKEDKDGNTFNLVGFQTNLKWGEQKRVFGLIPALRNAEYTRYGVMHRNTFINSPKVLNSDLSVKGKENLYFAGQITGVEGYVESTASGLITAIEILRKILNKPFVDFTDKTVIGALTKYITTENVDFEPMNANFGIIPPPEEHIRDKAERKKYQAQRSLKIIDDKLKEIKDDRV